MSVCVPAGRRCPAGGKYYGLFICNWRANPSVELSVRGDLPRFLLMRLRMAIGKVRWEGPVSVAFCLTGAVRRAARTGRQDRSRTAGLVGRLCQIDQFQERFEFWFLANRAKRSLFNLSNTLP